MKVTHNFLFIKMHDFPPIFLISLFLELLKLNAAFMQSPFAVLLCSMTMFVPVFLDIPALAFAHSFMSLLN